MSHFPSDFLVPCLDRWLNTTRKYHSHYGGFLFNHLAHNFVVIAASSRGLQRSPEHLEAKLKWWSDIYIPLHALDGALARDIDDSMPLITEKNWNMHLDKTIVNYPAYLAFFDQQLQSDDVAIKDMIKEFVPSLGAV